MGRCSTWQSAHREMSGHSSRPAEYPHVGHGVLPGYLGGNTKGTGGLWCGKSERKPRLADGQMTICKCPRKPFPLQPRRAGQTQTAKLWPPLTPDLTEQSTGGIQRRMDLKWADLGLSPGSAPRTGDSASVNLSSSPGKWKQTVLAEQL